VNVNPMDVLDVLSSELDLDDGDITVESAMGDVDNWDSLGHLRVCMALELRFGIRIPMDTVGSLGSVPAILEYLKQE
jgi:acyl carrier protein